MMLEARGLRKRYGTLVAVDGVSFGVSKGEMLALLGPNGAGKTTTVSMICGLLAPDSGQVLIEGRTLGGDTDPLKRRIGLVPQDLALYEQLTALENLELFGALYGLSGRALSNTIGANLELVGLNDRKNDPAGAFSGGMKRRLNLAAALLHDPEIILLDEPTTGVDPQSRNAIFENLEELKRRGKAMVYTTHYMEEAERLCDRVVIVDHGKVIADDTRQGLYKRLPGANVLAVELESEPAADPGKPPGAEWVEWNGRALRAGLADLADSAKVLDWIASRGMRIEHFSSERANLEAVFLTLTGRSLRDK